jgi:sugar lactone lactonase YvrE
LGNLMSGIAALSFVDGNLYALTAGAGCSHGLLGTSNGVLRVNSNGTTTLVANLSAYQAAHPVAHPEPDDFEPDGTWYSMVAVRGDLYAVEPNHGEVVRVSPTTGAIQRVVDVSASQGHIVPTSIAYRGNFFVGNLGTFPVVPGSEKILKLTPSGRLKVWATGLSTVLGLAVDSEGRLYALESMTQAGGPGPAELGTGMIVRIEHSGALTTIATGLSFPTGMTFGPDGALYVSNLGFAGPGAGQILKVVVPGIAAAHGDDNQGDDEQGNGQGHGHDRGHGNGHHH